MLAEALSTLLSQLNQYVHRQDGNAADSPDVAVAGNIGQLDNPDISTELDNHLVLTLTNVEEEGTLKNGPALVREPGGLLLYRNPPLHLNLHLLISANYRNYQTALLRLAQVLTFFQGKKHFSASNSPRAEPSQAVRELSLTVDLVSLSFEEINHLWGSLGGRQLPSAFYRGRLITLTDERDVGGGGEITEVQVVGRNA